MRRSRRSLSRWETLGAWLRVWTPPRDVRVPPVPWRKVAAIAAAVAVAAGVAAAIAVPRIVESKDETAAEERRERERLLSERRRRATAEQRARTGRAPVLGRAAIAAHVEDEIGRDARRRFDPEARTAACAPAPGEDATAPVVRLKCLSATADVRGAGVRGAIGIPYVAVVDFPARRYAFCKVNPVPGEQVVPDPRTVVDIPPACRTRRR